MQSYKIASAFMIKLFSFPWPCHSNAALCVWCRKKMHQEDLQIPSAWEQVRLSLKEKGHDSPSEFGLRK